MEFTLGQEVESCFHLDFSPVRPLIPPYLLIDTSRTSWIFESILKKPWDNRGGTLALLLSKQVIESFRHPWGWSRTSCILSTPEGRGQNPLYFQTLSQSKFSCHPGQGSEFSWVGFILWSQAAASLYVSSDTFQTHAPSPGVVLLFHVKGTCLRSHLSSFLFYG